MVRSLPWNRGCEGLVLQITEITRGEGTMGNGLERKIPVLAGCEVSQCRSPLCGIFCMRDAGGAPIVLFKDFPKGIGAGNEPASICCIYILVGRLDTLTVTQPCTSACALSAKSHPLPHQSPNNVLRVQCTCVSTMLQCQSGLSGIRVYVLSQSAIAPCITTAHALFPPISQKSRARRGHCRLKLMLHLS